MTASNLLEPAKDTQPGELFRNGQLNDAVTAQLARVKANPADQAERLFLFELLVFQGDYDRAGRQIAAIDYGDPTLDATIAVYRRLLDAERVRQNVFAGKGRPEFLAESPSHTALRLQAVLAIANGELAEAAKLLSQATEQTPTITGQINEKPFSLLVDCDDVFGTVLEVISATGAYFWVPLEQICTLDLEAPRFPRDLIWMSATVELTDGQQGEVYLPVLYPNSSRSSDDQIRLGRQTDWQAAENNGTSGPTLGFGMRTFLVDDNLLGALDLRSLQINHS
jgi:type VI secretion system protein ImpE